MYVHKANIGLRLKRTSAPLCQNYKAAGSRVCNKEVINRLRALVLGDRNGDRMENHALSVVENNLVLPQGFGYKEC